MVHRLGTDNDGAYQDEEYGEHGLQGKALDRPAWTPAEHRRFIVRCHGHVVVWFVAIPQGSEGSR